MAANGRGKKSKAGQSTGPVDTKMNGHTNGHVSRPSKPVRQRRRASASGRGFSIAARFVTVRSSSAVSSNHVVFARLLLWYTIATVLFRCPSSPAELTEDSPRVCKPYFTVRTHTLPYTQPYYDAYVAPYVDHARPYYDRLDKQIITPATAFTSQKYETYGAPRVAQAQKYAQSQWEKSVRPQLQTAQAKAKAQYDASLAPHVDKASAAVLPYYDNARSTVLDTYQQRLLPAYVASMPYAQQVYAQGHHLAVDVVYPYFSMARRSSTSFLKRTIWPRLRILYGENVEPQLMRISERLGRYKDSKKLEAAVESVDVYACSHIATYPALLITSSSSSLNSATSTVESLTSSAAGTIVEAAQSIETPTSSAVAESPDSKDESREKIENDLKTWQEKFARAADKGSEDLEGRVKEISERQVDSQAHGVGKALVVELEGTTEASVQRVKDTIARVVKRLPDNPSDDDFTSAYEEVNSATRTAGQSIKSKAQAIRAWKQGFDEETFNLVKAASDSTLEVIDNIRDLGLQEIGMRWAWMEGVTYKDWAKYHALKKTFDEWRDEVQATAMEHEGLHKAKHEGHKIEEEAMKIAEEAAKELARLKDVAKWKIYAQDDTDDFSTKIIPAAAANIYQKVVGKVSDASSAVAGSTQGTMESVASSVSKAAADAVSTASSAVVGTETGSVESAASKVSEAVVGSQAATDSIASVVSSKASDASVGAQSVLSAAKYKKDQASASIIGTPPPVHESLASEASSSLSSASSKASSNLHSASSEASSSLSSASSVASQAYSSATKPSKKVWGGAMAEVVTVSKIVIEDDIVEDDTSYSEKIQNIVSGAGDRAADLTRAISEALMQPATATGTQGSVESITSLASEQYEKAMSAASNILYGTEQGTAESLSSVAADKYAQAVTA